MSPHITTKKKYMERLRQNMPYEASVRVLSLNVFFLVVVVCAALGYVLLLHTLVSRGYALKTLSERLSVLAERQEKLGRELAEQRSPERIAQEVVSLGLVDAQQLSYVSGPAAVAKAVFRGVE